jgi:hypothetical protein
MSIQSDYGSQRIAGFARFRSGSREAAIRGEISQMRRCEPFKATSAHAIRRSDVAPNGATSFSGLKVAIFTTNVDAENQTLINHKCVCGVLNRHFCQTRVIGWRSCLSWVTTISMSSVCVICRVLFCLACVSGVLFFFEALEIF